MERCPHCNSELRTDEHFKELGFAVLCIIVVGIFIGYVLYLKAWHFVFLNQGLITPLLIGIGLLSLSWGIWVIYTWIKRPWHNMSDKMLTIALFVLIISIGLTISGFRLFLNPIPDAPAIFENHSVTGESQQNGWNWDQNGR